MAPGLIELNEFNSPVLKRAYSLSLSMQNEKRRTKTGSLLKNVLLYSVQQTYFCLVIHSHARILYSESVAALPIRTQGPENGLEYKFIGMN